MAGNGMKRRDFLKAAATTPVLGAFGVALYSKESHDKAAREEILQLGKKVSGTNPNILKRNYKRSAPASGTINIGIVGCGGRGKSLMRSCGFHPPEDPQPRGLEGQESLNLKLTAFFDLSSPISTGLSRLPAAQPRCTGHTRNCSIKAI